MVLGNEVVQLREVKKPVKLLQKRVILHVALGEPASFDWNFS